MEIGKGFSSAKEIIGDIKVEKRIRNVLEWQDLASRMADDLFVLKSPRWFKFFKVAFETSHDGLLHSAFTYCVDSNFVDKEKLFYWYYHNHKKDKKRGT